MRESDALDTGFAARQDVEDSSPLLRPKLRGCSEPLGKELLDEVVHLLAMSNSREGAVLAAGEHAGVQHHRNEEAGLAIGETERRIRSATNTFWPTEAYSRMSEIASRM